MSIIHDALKKVSASIAIKTEPKEDKKPIFWIPIAVLLIIICGIAFMYKNAQNLPSLPTLIKIAQPKSKPLVKSAVAITENKKASSPTGLSIEGIVSQKGSTLALINNKIYEVGDDIADAKILAITADGVTILKDGKEETVLVRH